MSPGMEHAGSPVTETGEYLSSLDALIETGGSKYKLGLCLGWKQADLSIN